MKLFNCILICLYCCLLLCVRVNCSSLCYEDRKYEEVVSQRYVFGTNSIALWPNIKEFSDGFSVYKIEQSILSPDVLYIWGYSVTGGGLFSFEDKSLSVLDILPFNIPKQTFKESSFTVFQSEDDKTSEHLLIANHSLVTICDVRFEKKNQQQSTSDIFAVCSKKIETPWGKFKSTSVNSIECTEQSDVCYFATSNGLYVLDLKSLSFSQVSVFGANECITVSVHGKTSSSEDFVVVAASNDNLFLYESQEWRLEWRHSIANGNITSTAFTSDGSAFYSSLDSVYAQGFQNRMLWRIDGRAGLPYNQTRVLKGSRFGSSGIDGKENIWIGTSEGLIRYQFPSNQPFPSEDEFPYKMDDIHVPNVRFRYFYGPRYLPCEGFEEHDNAIFDISVRRLEDGSESVWALTPKGLSHFVSIYQTLSQKAQHYEDMVRPRHDRFGLIAECDCDKFGDIDHCVQPSSDNDGLWTSLYVAAESFRYSTTKDASAKKNAWRSFEAMEFLNNVTGVKGLMARSILPRGAPIPGGTWHNSTKYPEWQWKADTSSDEVTGHMQAYPLVLDIVAETSEEKERVKNLILDIVSYIVDNGFYLIDVTGRPTTWGVWAPKELNLGSHWYDERGLNSLQMLSFLLSAYRVSGGDEKYSQAAEYLVSQGYDWNIVNLKITVPDDDNFSDDELAFLPYHLWIYSLSFWPDNMKVPKVFQDLTPYFDLSLNRTFNIISKERSNLWNLIYGSRYADRSQKNGFVNKWKDMRVNPSNMEVNVGNIIGVPALENMYRIISDAVWCIMYWPMELVNWPHHNSHRLDIHLDPYSNRGGSISQEPNEEPLPPNERDAGRWNADPWEIDGGSGTVELDPGAILMPYWLGRFWEFIC